MVFDSVKFKTKRDMETAEKLLQKIHEYIMYVYGANSDIGIFWLKFIH